LGVDEVGTLVERWTGGAPGERLAAGLAAAAGNPLFVREVVDAWSRTGRLSLEHGVLELDERAGPGDAGVGSLAVAIADRLDFLSSRCREALRTAALLGAEFSPAELGGVAGLGTADLVAVVEESIAAGVLEPAGSRLRFRHGLIKQALYEATPSAVRALLLRHVVQWLIETGAGTERVARFLHVIAETDALDDRALDWLVEHVGEVVGLAPTLAYDLIENALGSLKSVDADFAVLEDHLVMVALHLGRSEVSERAARSILAAGPDPDRRGQALWNLSYTLQRQGRAQEGLDLISEETVGYRPGSLWHARLTALRALGLCTLHRLDEADATAAQALAEGENLDDPMACAYALHAASTVAQVRGQPAESMRRIDHGLTLVAADPRLTDIKLMMLSNRAGRLADMDRYAESAAELRRVQAIAEQIATPRLASIQKMSVSAAYEKGRWDEVDAGVDAVLDLGFLETNRQAAADILGLAALVAVHRDDSESCARHLTLARAAEHEVQSVYTIMARALIAERTERPEQGLSILTAVLDHERIGGNARCVVLPTLAQMAWRLGEDGVTRHAADLAAWDNREMRNLPQAEAAARWCGALADRDPAMLLEVAGYYRSIGQLIDLGNALEGAAVLEVRAGRREAARDAITEAMAVYSRLGALWDARRAKSRLRAEGLQIGARGPRKRPSTGSASLTPTESQVAQLVARGGSNTEIAERLALSRHTVEVHVSHILAKLQIRSRHDVARVITP